VTLHDLLVPIFRHRKFLIGTCIIGILLGVAHYFLVAPIYEARFVVLPPQEDRGNVLRGMGDLAMLAGLNVGGASDPSALYPAVLHSQRLLTAVMDSANAAGQRVGKAREFPTDAAGREKALKRLRRRISVTRDKTTGVVAVRARLGDPDLVAVVARTLLGQLDAYFMEVRRTRAAADRAFLDGRIGELNTTLIAAEIGLRDFLEQNREVGSSPELQLEAARLRREVTLQETVYIELQKQRELARMAEARDSSALSILDEPRATVRPVFPTFLKSTLLAFALVVLLGLAWVYTVTYGLPYLRRESVAP
jgi:uncharacterized protein involved in exopolysaccharide biosynthesis